MALDFSRVSLWTRRGRALSRSARLWRQAHE